MNKTSFDESNNNNNVNRCYSCSSPETSSSSQAHTLAAAMPKKRAGRRIFKETRHPVFRGVRRRNNDKWVCEVRVPNDKSTRIWLGTYPTPEMAARAHDVAALALRGKSACLNFADSAWRLPLPASTNSEEIRRVAAEAAAAFAAEDISVGEDDDSNGKALRRGFCDLDEITMPDNASDFEWFRCMADEPLRSPTFVTYYRDFNFVEDDAEVSLWSFSI
ncbi:hypothetical protein Fmac_026043 [Flemingia macrophylla]|uniref:AP2/ERF domain-containing protein n=1 Tax=Flemingia macrophylla TaxID=520843 RepID=A0ABD1LDR7_9FABA